MPKNNKKMKYYESLRKKANFQKKKILEKKLKIQNSRLTKQPVPIGQGMDYWGYESHLSPIL